MAKIVSFQPTGSELNNFKSQHQPTDPNIVSFGTFARSSTRPIRPYQASKGIYVKKRTFNFDKDKELGTHSIIKKKDKFQEMDLNDYITAKVVKNETPKRPFSRDYHGRPQKAELVRPQSATGKVKYDKRLNSARGEWLWANNKPESHFKNYKRPQSARPKAQATEAQTEQPVVAAAEETKTPEVVAPAEEETKTTPEVVAPTEEEEKKATPEVVITAKPEKKEETSPYKYLPYMTEYQDEYLGRLNITPRTEVKNQKAAEDAKKNLAQE